jgi:hypothetical protein
MISLNLVYTQIRHINYYVVGVFHNSHLIQLQRLLKGVQEVFKLFAYLENELLGLQFLVDVEMEEVLNRLGVKYHKLVLERFLDRTETENDLSEGTSETSDNVLTLGISINLNNVLTHDVLL